MSASQISASNSLTPPLCGSAPAVQKDGTARQVQQALRSGVLDALGVKSHGHGIRGVAAALRDLLANADPGAPDPVPSLLETINTALDTAAKKLADQSVDQASIDAGVKRFRADLSRALDSLAPVTADPAPAQTNSTSNSAAVHSVTKEKLTLNILTAEGDRVSIRFRATQVTDIAAAQTSGDGGSTSAVDAHVIERGKLRIDVQGELDDSELQAIGDLLDKVNGIAQDFFGGDVQAAFGAAARVDYDSGELSGFSLRLTYSQRVGFASTYAAASPPAVTAPATPATSAPAAALPKQAAVPAALDPVSVPPASAPTESAPAESTAAATTPSAPAPAATARVESAQQTIASFAKTVLAQLAQVEDAGSVRFSMRWKVEFLMTAISASQPAGDKTAAKSTQVLGAALNGNLPAAS